MSDVLYLPSDIALNAAAQALSVLEPVGTPQSVMQQQVAFGA